MARFKPILAILLALALLVSPIPLAYADGPPVLGSGGGTKDGHPWDDETTESDPDLDPNALSQHIGPIIAPTVAAAHMAYVPGSSGASFVGGVVRTLFSSWTRISEIKSARRSLVSKDKRR